MVRTNIDATTKHGHRRHFHAPLCPNCGVPVLTAESSEYVSDGRIRHRWLCDDCDHDFRTVVRIPN